MPPIEYSWEIRERAKELYVVDGLTFEEVAAALSQEFPSPTPSITQLKRWSAEEGEWVEKTAEGEKKGKDWPEARKEFRLALSSIRRDSVLLRAKLIGNALGEPEFKRVLSAAMWEKTQQTKNQGAASAPVTTGTPAVEPIGAEAIVIKTPQEAVAAVEEALGRHLRAMLTGAKSIDLKTLKDFRESLALVEELKTKYRPAEGEGEAPEETEETRRRLVAEVDRILGVK